MVKSMAKAGAKGVLLYRIEISGQPEDTLQELDWVPEPWKQAKHLPAKLDSCGGPWLLGRQAGLCRSQFGLWPLCGFGQALVNLSGSCILCSWPIASLLAKGEVNPAAHHEFLGQMHTAAFANWANANMVYAVLEELDMAWVPYGWANTLAGLSSLNMVLLQPIVCWNMSVNCKIMGSIAQAQTESVKKWMENSRPVWKNIGQSFLDWLGNLEVPMPAANVPPPLPAIRDGSPAANRRRPRSEESLPSLPEETQEAKEGDEAEEEDKEDLEEPKQHNEELNNEGSTANPSKEE